MQLLGISSLSLCTIRLPHASAAGLLLWAQCSGDADQLLQQPRENAGSATLSAYVAKHRLVLGV